MQENTFRSLIQSMVPILSIDLNMPNKHYILASECLLILKNFSKAVSKSFTIRTSPESDLQGAQV